MNLALKLALTLSLTAFGALGCGSDEGAKTTGTGAPDWAMMPPKGCGAQSAKVRGNLGMARDTAVARARNDVAKQIETINQSMFKDYQQSGEADGKDFTEELQTQVLRQITDQKLVGTVPVKVKQIDNQLYALVCIDTETFAGIYDKMNNMSEKVRQGLRNRAKTEMADLDKQLEKIRARD